MSNQEFHPFVKTRLCSVSPTRYEVSSKTKLLRTRLMGALDVDVRDSEKKTSRIIGMDRSSLQGKSFYSPVFQETQ